MRNIAPRRGFSGIYCPSFGDPLALCLAIDVEEMQAVEKAIEAGKRERIPSLLSDRWLADTTLFGSAATVREGVEAWRASGVRTRILVPSSAAGNQLKAFEELFAAFA